MSSLSPVSLYLSSYICIWCLILLWICFFLSFFLSFFLYLSFFLASSQAPLSLFSVARMRTHGLQTSWTYFITQPFLFIQYICFLSIYLPLLIKKLCISIFITLTVLFLRIFVYSAIHISTCVDRKKSLYRFSATIVSGWLLELIVVVVVSSKMKKSVKKQTDGLNDKITKEFL